MRLLLATVLLALAPPLPAAPVAAEPEAVADYLPADVSFASGVPTPRSVLGFEVGERHVRPDQIVEYFRALAESSDRVHFEIQGRTHEGRPQVLLTIASPENLARREEIRERHRAATEGVAESAAVGADDLPVIVWLAYSIHGNEASGSNAALAVAYYLAAGEGPEVQRILDGSIVLLDPMQNPDGLGRFAEWVNMHRGEVPSRDPQDREHLEVWPGGRGNHYWFDLNRDWLFLVHPESRNRVATYQKWRPHVVADFHEMGSDSTYFFQPGVPSRTNPLTPDRNQQLTERLAEYHADAFDRAGRLYYHGETFDDFYYGKGSTYPDIQGSVGVLFEQASVGGHRLETAFGVREFPFAVQNHVLTSLSTLRGALELAPDLREHQREFFARAAEEAARSSLGGWVCSTKSAPERGRRLAELQSHHDVRVYRPERAFRLGDLEHEPAETIVIPVRQRQARLLETLFERRSEYPDSTFYDVSTWTLPLAYDLPCTEATTRQWSADWTARPWEPRPAVDPSASASEATVGYLLDWTHDLAPRALTSLLREGVRVQVALDPLAWATDSGVREHPAGTLVIARGIQDEEIGDLDELVAEVAEQTGVPAIPVSGGFSRRGLDLGSPNLPPVVAPRPAILVGPGASSYETGELWHLLDHDWGVEVSLLDRAHLEDLELDRYTHLFFTSGSYDALGEDGVQRILSWVRDGGALVATRDAARWAGEKLLAVGGNGEEGGAAKEAAEKTNDAGEDEASAGAEKPPVRLPYGEYEAMRAEQSIAGAIFEVRLDRTHPLGFGYPRDAIPVFHRGTWMMEPSENPFENVALYREDPWLSGYVSKERRTELGGTAAVIASRVGRGVVIRIADDPSFRGFWLATQPLVANSLFFSGTIESTSSPSSW